MGTRYWPLFDLRVETPRLTLRYVDDDLAGELVELAANGIHDPATMPFSIPWTDLPSPRFEREALQFHWGRRAGLRPEAWALPMAVIVDGVTVGLTDLLATDFPRLRGVATGSWLGRDFQGQGIGKEMRIATLTLGFDGLGADYATTGAFHDNEASKGVTRSLGYEPTGWRDTLRRNERDTILEYRMSREHWLTIRRDDITIHGLEPCLDLLGVE
ncbi:MAG: GNAT family protein, partial [Ilumatobacteraceae bacterium]